MTTDTTKAALADLPPLPNHQYCLNSSPVLQGYTATQMREYAHAALLRAGAAKVPEDALLADAKALRKMLAGTQTAVVAAVALLVIDDMPGQIAELLAKTAYLRDAATPPAPDAGVVEEGTK